MKLFDGNRYLLRQKEGGAAVAEGLSALEDGIDIVLVEPPHLDPIPPGGTYPRYPEYEAFHWLNLAYDDRNAQSAKSLAEHFGLAATPITDDAIQEGDEVAAYGFSSEEAERQWWKGARAKGWEPLPAPDLGRLALTEVDQARPRPNCSVWRASARVTSTQTSP